MGWIMRCIAPGQAKERGFVFRTWKERWGWWRWKNGLLDGEGSSLEKRKSELGLLDGEVGERSVCAMVGVFESWWARLVGRKV